MINKSAATPENGRARPNMDEAMIHLLLPPGTAVPEPSLNVPGRPEPPVPRSPERALPSPKTLEAGDFLLRPSTRKESVKSRRSAPQDVLVAGQMSDCDSAASIAEKVRRSKATSRAEVTEVSVDRKVETAASIASSLGQA